MEKLKSISIEVFKAIIKEVNKRGGLTVSGLHAKGYGTIEHDAGYMVGGYSPVIVYNPQVEDDGGARVVEHLNFILALLDGVNPRGLYLGFWINEVGAVEIELSRHFLNKDIAIREGKKRLQRYIFDIKNNQAIKL